PHVPRSQTRLQPVTSRKSRSVSSSVVRGSTLVVIFWPLTSSVTLTGAGPRPTGAAACAASAADPDSVSGSVARAVAAAAAPEPLRNWRRDSPRPLLARPCGSFMMLDRQERRVGGTEEGPKRPRGAVSGVRNLHCLGGCDCKVWMG